MDDNTVVIQEFEPEHLDGVVRLHHECFSVDINLSMRLGPKFLRATYKFFLDDPKSFGFVAFCQDKMVGFVCGRLGLFAGALNRYRAPVGALALLGRPWILFEVDFRKRLMQAVAKFTARKKAVQDADATPKRDGPTATLASLGVHPDYVHLRLSDRLLAAAESFCKSEQMQFVRAGVWRSNISSRFLYRRRGYTEDPGKTKGEALFYYLSLEDNK